LLFPTSYLVESVSGGWLLCCQKYVTALTLRSEVIFAYHWRQNNWTCKDMQVFIRPKKRN